MKRLILLLLISCSVFAVKAQIPLGGGSSIVGRISGVVIDSLTKKPLDYATVGIYRSGGKAPINGVITDEKGAFKLDNIKPGNYKLVISFIGYPSKTIDPVSTTDAHPDKNMGTIVVAPSTKTLKEVNVVGQAALVENHIDKIVYNAEKDLTAAGGTATDVLGKVPMVAVDMNGNVSVRGDQNVRVLINGKPSGASAANLADVLKSIPADQIKSIEVITSPSAKYDAEGSAGIINIITKQKNVSGFSGSINGGIGTRQNNGNLNLNYNHNRFHASVNLGGNLSWPQTSYTDFEQKIYNDTSSTTTSANSSSRVKRHAYNNSFSAGYDFNAYNSINTSFRMFHFQFGTDGVSNTNINSIRNGIATNTQFATNTNQFNSFGNFDWNIDYTRKFKKEGEELDFSTQWSHGTGTTDYTNIYTPQINPNLENNIVGINNEYTFQLDYTLPINKVFKLEAGGKTIIRRINSTSDYFTYNNTSQDFVYSDALSNIYDYDQNVYAGYSVFTITLPKQWTLLVGARDEVTDINGDPINATQALSPFSQNYNTFVPSLTVQKQTSATNTLKLAYSKRITRPSLQYLNPFVNQSNIQSQSVGNPELGPEVSQTIELDDNAFFGSSILNTSIYYKHTTGLIEGIAKPIPAINNVEGGTFTQYENIGNNNSIGGSIFGSVTPWKILTVMGNINAYTYKPDPAGVYNLDKSQNGTYVQYGGFLRATLTLPSNWLAEAFAFGNSARHNIQGTQPAFSIYGVGIRKQFMDKKMSLGVNALQPFANYKYFNSTINSPGIAQTSSTQIPFRSFGITFSYSFGKLTFSNPNQKKGVNNDDLKQGDQNQGGGAPAGGPGRE